ncbi:hypothetical protein [Mesorhizobium sp.]|uniref:hypothetical protein n=1 Tax=Mesorhizobium sp. TaxID=1871066 RepID=UPI003BAA4F73
MAVAFLLAGRGSAKKSSITHPEDEFYRVTFLRGLSETWRGHGGSKSHSRNNESQDWAHLPTYGNYGGPGWTGGARGGGFDLPPFDIQDGFYKQHDKDYDDAKTPDETIAADRKLISSLRSYLDNKHYVTDPALKTEKQRDEAYEYAWGAMKAFQAKVAGEVHIRDEAKRAYDDAQSTVGRARFGNGMSFGNW